MEMELCNWNRKSSSCLRKGNGVGIEIFYKSGIGTEDSEIGIGLEHSVLKKWSWSWYWKLNKWN